MFKQFRLLLTASFLLLSPVVQGSTINQDDDGDVAAPAHTPVSQVARTMQIATAASSATPSPSQDLQCYRITSGTKQPLFDKEGRFLDRRIPVGDPRGSTPVLAASQRSDGLEVAPPRERSTRYA